MPRLERNFVPYDREGEVTVAIVCSGRAARAITNALSGYFDFPVGPGLYRMAGVTPPEAPAEEPVSNGFRQSEVEGAFCAVMEGMMAANMDPRDEGDESLLPGDTEE